LLILNLLQPWAAANAGAGVICTVAGAAPDGDGPVPIDCPLCLSGTHCQAPLPGFGKALTPVLFSLAGRDDAALRIAFASRSALPGPAADARPASIRAPPLSV